MEQLPSRLTAPARILAERLEQGERLIVGLDGPAASGKTTAAAALHTALGGTLIHMDDFFLPPALRTPTRLAEPGGNVDYARFCAEVAAPLRRGGLLHYGVFSCAQGAIVRTVRELPRQLVLVEGSYALHPQFADLYDLRIFCPVDPVEQRRRILARNGPDWAQDFFDRWIPLENAYFAAFQIKDSCDLILLP